MVAKGVVALVWRHLGSGSFSICDAVVVAGDGARVVGHGRAAASTSRGISGAGDVGTVRAVRRLAAPYCAGCATTCARDPFAGDRNHRYGDHRRSAWIARRKAGVVDDRRRYRLLRLVWRDVAPADED